MLLPNIVTGIEVCIEAIATVTTQEETLRTTVVTSLMSTFATGLGRVSRVDFHDLDTSFLCFVEDEAIQLSKAPPVKTSLRVSFLAFAIANLRGCSNVGEIFQNESAARSGMLNNSLREDVIAIPVESHLLAGEV